MITEGVRAPARSLFKNLIINELAILIIADFFYTIDFQLLTAFKNFPFELKRT